MPRIVILSRRNIRHPQAGGASQYLHEVFKRLTDSHNITILSEGAPSARGMEEIDGIRYFNVGKTFPRFTIPIQYIVNFARKADLLIDHADVAIPWLSPLFTSKRRITIVHQLVKEIYYYQLSRPWAEIGFRAEKPIYRLYSNSRIVTSSGSAARELEELGIPNQYITTITPGYDKRNTLRHQLRDREARIGCVSRLMRYKGIQNSLRAFRELLLTCPQATFQIAGSGPYEQTLRNLARVLGIDRSVEFHGRVSQDEKFDILSKSRVAVFPSIRDGFGISVIEANSVGTPVVAWDVPGPQDSIINGVTGLLTPFPNEHIFASNLRTILTEDETWERMSQSAWKIAGEFSWDRAASTFEDVIDSTLKMA
jgi:glycosyltransferase involved in cell wall biosynthesis